VKIFVISDTHAYSIDELPGKLVDQLSGAELIIHAGDFTGKKLLDDLRKIGPLRAVYGNIDGPDIRHELKAVEVVEEGGFKIGVNHPSEGGDPHTLEERLKPKFPGCQVIIHGHSHQAKNILRDGILWFNPGSATGRFPARETTYGILNVAGEIKGEILRL
jgi:uncharacterized protein